MQTIAMVKPKEKPDQMTEMRCTKRRTTKARKVIIAKLDIRICLCVSGQGKRQLQDAPREVHKIAYLQADLHLYNVVRHVFSTYIHTYT